MAKFKVGDRVRVVKTVRGARDARIGDIGTIKIKKEHGANLKYVVEFDNSRFAYHSAGGCCKDCHGYLCSDEMLELVKPETIVIYSKGNEVIALDKSTGKKAIARCCPEDTFDFNTGAKLAFDRLWLNNKYGAPNVRVVKRPAKPGEYIRIINPSACSEDEYKKGDILKVVEYVSPYRHTDGRAYYKKQVNKFAYLEEYVVLEGYEPEEPEEPKKQPYNGKIIFTKGDDTFRTGRIYEIKDGKLKVPVYGTLPGFSRKGYDTLYSIEDVKDYFSSAEDREKSGLHGGCGWSTHGLEFIEVQDD